MREESTNSGGSTTPERDGEGDMETTDTFIGCEKCQQPLEGNAWLVRTDRGGLMIVHHWCAVRLAMRGQALHTVVR